MAISPLSNEIFLSREAIRTQLIEEIKQYLDLVDVDLTKSSFLSYIINILSTLTSNILFYQISVYKEFFLTKAQLNNSVMDLAASIGYTPYNAKHSTINLILSFPFRFTDGLVTFVIPKYSNFKIDNINFIIDYNVKVVVERNNIVTAYKYDKDVSENLSVYIDYDNEVMTTFNIMIYAKQYNVEKFEFSVNKNHLEYQFTEYEIRLDGQLSAIEVKVVEPGNDIEYIYDQFSSIYLMSPNDRGFVIRKSDIGQKIYFGNGLIGYQPPVNSIIYVTAFTTLGERGNIISGQNIITDNIYGVTGTGERVEINYSVSNPSPAQGGEDEPSLEVIKANAINNLTALHRLVSENDYKVVGSLAEDTPLAKNTYPVLKRSDIRTNEMQIYSILMYKNEIVPTENVHITLDSTACENIQCDFNDGIIKIPKYQEISYLGDIYILPFNIEIDKDLEITRYKYTSKEVIYDLNLISVGLSLEEYNFFATSLLVETDYTTVYLKVYFQTTETDFDEVECLLEVTNTLVHQNMTINTVGRFFEISFTPYELLPENKETYYFTFYHPTKGRLNQYSISFIFRKNLNHTMLSNTVINKDGSISIYDIPVIRKDYYDLIANKADFEYYVIQRIIDNINFEDIRMMTDFVNLKFANTSKELRNMLLNKETRLPVDYIDLEYVNWVPQINERYIINGTEFPEWQDKIGYIATCISIDTTSGEIDWTYVKPEMDDFIYARNTNKKYLYTSCDWIEPIYEIPLKIDLDVRMKENYTIDMQKFINTIKLTILETFKDRMVCQSYLSRSEIIATVQNIEGVDHCRLIKPASNIFYNFKLEELSEENLLTYTPELLYFTEDDITIRLVN